MIDVPNSEPVPGERGRLHAEGQRADDNSWHTLLIVHEADSSWTIHGLGAPGVRLSAASMVALAESVLKRARR